MAASDQGNFYFSGSMQYPTRDCYISCTKPTRADAYKWLVCMNVQVYGMDQASRQAGLFMISRLPCFVVGHEDMNIYLSYTPLTKTVCSMDRERMQ